MGQQRNHQVQQYQTLNKLHESKGFDVTSVSDLDNFDISRQSISNASVSLAERSSVSQNLAKQRYAQITRAIQEKKVIMGKVGQLF